MISFASALLCYNDIVIVYKMNEEIIKTKPSFLSSVNDIVVSIVCEVYNHEAYLQKCLDGFVMQKTNFKFEVLIHDDASTDGSVEIIKRYVSCYPGLFKPILQRENQYSQGISVWQKFQFSRACGKYIALCEGDDYWTDPQKLQKQVEVLDSHLDCTMVFGRVLYFSQRRNAFVFNKQYKGGTGYVDSRDVILKGGLFVPTCSIMFRRELVHALYEKSYVCACHVGDYPLQIFCAITGHVYFLDDVMSVYRVENSSSWLGRQKKEDMEWRLKGLESELDMLKGFSNDYPKYGVILKRRINYAINSLYRPENIPQYIRTFEKVRIRYADCRTKLWDLDLNLRTVKSLVLRKIYHGLRFLYRDFRI